MQFKAMDASVAASTSFNVTEIRYTTPKMTATTIVKQDDSHVWVKCETEGCTRTMTEGKRRWFPVDFADIHGAYVEERITAPSARVCASCPRPRR